MPPSRSTSESSPFGPSRGRSRVHQACALVGQKVSPSTSKRKAAASPEATTKMASQDLMVEQFAVPRRAGQEQHLDSDRFLRYVLAAVMVAAALPGTVVLALVISETDPGVVVGAATVAILTILALSLWVRPGRHGARSGREDERGGAGSYPIRTQPHETRDQIATADWVDQAAKIKDWLWLLADEIVEVRRAVRHTAADAPEGQAVALRPSKNLNVIAADLGEVAKSMRAVAENMSGLYRQGLYHDEGVRQSSPNADNADLNSEAQAESWRPLSRATQLPEQKKELC
jgi:hypothetical protein